MWEPKKPKIDKVLMFLQFFETSFDALLFAHEYQSQNSEYIYVIYIKYIIRMSVRILGCWIETSKLERNTLDEVIVNSRFKLFY